MLDNGVKEGFESINEKCKHFLNYSSFNSLY